MGPIEILPVIRYLRAGMFAAFGFLLVLGFFSFAAPLAGAIVAQGQVVSERDNFKVQHLEGGIIEQVLVEDGQWVEIGAPVLKLNRTASDAELSRLQARMLRLKLEEHRLVSLHQDAPNFDPPVELLASYQSLLSQPDTIENERARFRALVEIHETEKRILQEQIAALEQEAEGLEIQLGALKRERVLIADDIAAKKALLRDGLAQKSDVTDLQIRQVRLEGEGGRLTSEKGRVVRRMAEIEEQLSRLISDRTARLLDELARVRLEIADVRERIAQVSNIDRRHVVVAPGSGRVMKLTKNATGDVIASGEVVMEIVPIDLRINIDAKIGLQDINDIRTGQSVTIRFSAYDEPELGNVSGTILKISPDTVEDQQTGEQFFVARIVADPVEIEHSAHTVIGAGQAAELFIQTGDRTLVEYLLKPISETLSRSLREP